MTCEYKHTKYQPSEDEFLCPKCGSSEFFIDESQNFDCEKLHEEDELFCESCRYTCSGKSFSGLIQKKKKLVKCPHCKGTGLVKDDK